MNKLGGNQFVFLAFFILFTFNMQICIQEDIHMSRHLLLGIIHCKICIKCVQKHYIDSLYTQIWVSLQKTQERNVSRSKGSQTSEQIQKYWEQVRLWLYLGMGTLNCFFDSRIISGKSRRKLWQRIPLMDEWKVRVIWKREWW